MTQSPTKAPPSRGLYKVVGKSLKKGRKILSDSPLLALGLSQKKAPKAAEVVDQSKILCEDYIYHRIEQWRGELDRELGSSCPVTVTDVSREIQLIGAQLEVKYPFLYQSISKQVNVAFKTEASVRKSLTTIGDVMFRHQVTWGRVVALFAVTGGMAVECMQNDHPELLRVIVTSFADVIERNVAFWICEQGGWVEIMKTFRFNRETRSLWVLTGLGIVIGFLFTWITTVQI